MHGFRTISAVRPNPPNRPATPIVDRRRLYSAAEWAAMEAVASAKAEAERSEAERARIAAEDLARAIAEAQAEADAARQRERVLHPEPITPGGPYRMLDLIALAVAVTGVSADDIRGPARHVPLVKARQIALWLLHAYSKRSLPEIGRRVGGRDHTTALHAVRKVAKLIEAIPGFDPSVPHIAARQLWALDWPRVKSRPPHVRRQR